MQAKIEEALIYAGMTKTELGRNLGMAQQNISRRIQTGKFTLEELQKIAHIMGAEYHCYFEFPDGTKIGE